MPGSGFVWFALADGSKVIGKQFPADGSVENRVSVLHNTMEGTFIHIGPGQSAISHRIIQAILNSDRFDEKSTSALFNILNSIEADCAMQLNKQ
ncbi:MAG: hypothetical protein PHX25_03585 [Candidatus Pacebacteria bacterium]|nr:hypothetical protein [Candidatus Paceibacterota bacterium]